MALRPSHDTIAAACLAIAPRLRPGRSSFARGGGAGGGVTAFSLKREAPYRSFQNDAKGRQQAFVNGSDAWEPCHYETR